MTELFQALSQELALVDLLRYTCNRQHREYFVDMFYVVPKLSLQNQYVAELDNACLEADPRKDKIKAALESGGSMHIP